MKVNFASDPVFVTAQECSLVVDQICNQFFAAGLQTLCTFNLTTALPADESCKCHMIILLVYGKKGPPFSISIFGELDYTTIKLQDSHFDTELAANLLSGVLSGNLLLPS